ncbi:MAG: carboxypeptidase-like regulatory domain-containing protein [Cyanobacteriota bacterium]
MNKKIISVLFSALFLLTACDKLATPINSSNNANQSKPTDDSINSVEISGKVDDDLNNPAKDVTIIIKEDNKVLGKTTTNEKGEFSIKVPKVFGGAYFVEASLELKNGSLNQTILLTSDDRKALFIGESRLKKTVLVATPPKPAT